MVKLVVTDLAKHQVIFSIIVVFLM